MLGRRRGNKSRVEISGKPCIEALELRTLLSGTAPLVAIHTDEIIRPDVGGTTVQGFTPSQIRHAYGFDKISQDGTGQTIAIVDAYDAPNIAADLATFDAQFNLPAPPSFLKVSETGSPTVLPSVDPGWAGEISLDVEWSHAMAPGANILLVEANAATNQDLMAAVNYARNAAGVSVVSMSWGGSEFFPFPGAQNFQTQYDPDFTTPAGHQGVTFIASSGDSGQMAGAQWPASAPTVLSVGGTNLSVADQNGTYSGEQSWAGSGGGYSTVETEPTFQDVAQSSGTHSVPDVAYD
ncbi:MAG TPA: S53 family peptidase, partial [Tepidisphaeraceae bacterium]|nr:S53 family peptidase [Tepidisphaeraceae bacterium]